MARFIFIEPRQGSEGREGGGQEGSEKGARRVDASNLSWTEAKLLGNWLEHVGRSARSRR